MLGPPVRGPRKGTDGNVRVARGGAASFDFDGLRRKVERAFREFLPEQLGGLVLVTVWITEGPGCTTLQKQSRERIILEIMIIRA
jgi:hypothetical protein